MSYTKTLSHLPRGPSLRKYRRNILSIVDPFLNKLKKKMVSESIHV